MLLAKPYLLLLALHNVAASPSILESAAEPGLSWTSNAIQACTNGTGKLVSEYVLPAAAMAKKRALDWMYENPVGATIAALGATLLAAPTAISIPILSVFGGFGTAGVKAGSLAAAWQAIGGKVAAGSLFATLQSAGAGGAGTTFVIGATKAVGVTAIVVGTRGAERLVASVRAVSAWIRGDAQPVWDTDKMRETSKNVLFQWFADMRSTLMTSNAKSWWWSSLTNSEAKSWSWSTSAKSKVKSWWH